MKRRDFIRNLGLAASLPLLSRTALSAEQKESRPLGSASTGFKVLTCNIRVALPEDEAQGNGWASRRDLCVEVIRAQEPDIICFQEVIREQMVDLQKAFPAFGSFGFEGPEMDARAVGYQGIAKNPIFYSRDRYQLITEGGFWLSETPHIPGSLSWGSARSRHMNFVRLRERATGRQLRVLNTHLDHIAQQAREEQFKMILAEAATYPQDFPQVLTGDFNASRANAVLKLAADAGWKDTFQGAPEPRDDGNTTHGFLGEKMPKLEAARKRGPIDFVLTRGPMATLAWRIVRDSREGRFPSDHYFLGVRLKLE